jgi:hypothetical protein
MRHTPEQIVTNLRHASVMLTVTDRDHRLI